MNERPDSQPAPSSLEDERPGSQGEIEAGSEGDFGDPEPPAPRPEEEPPQPE